jgi:hypothetical protein
MPAAERVKRLMPRAAYAAAALVAAFYFFQYSTLSPNHTDEGLILQYIDDIAHGEWPFYDFIDAYGLLNWIFPVAFYESFGETVWGVRMWMIVLKLVTLFSAYFLVRRLTPVRALAAANESEVKWVGGRFYAAVAALWITVLLGVPWQSLQTAYAFNNVLPLVIGTWYFVLCRPAANPKKNVYVAGVLTAAAIWTKLNTGIYLLAGGLFAYFFWIPVAFSDAPRNEPDKARLLFRVARTGGAVTYVALFSYSLRPHMNAGFATFLVLPLVIGIAWNLKTELVSKTEPNRSVRAYLEPWAHYLATGGGLSLLVLFGYYGKWTGRYAAELSGIFNDIDYTATFPPLGLPGTYVGLNEFYWLELSWALSFFFVVWLLLAERMGPRAYGDTWPERRAQVSALFVFVTLHSFVIYARADETHIYQTLVPVVIALFVVLAQLDAFLRAAAKSQTAYLPFRAAVGGFGVLYASTIAVIPTMDCFDLSRSDWHDPKLVHLKYRERHSRYTRDFSPSLSDHDWDRAEDEADEYVKSISEPGEEVLLLTANRLFYFNSNTRPPGGRYHFYFYLVAVGLLDRTGFDRLVPKEVVQDILLRPPRVIVAAYGHVPLAEQFPEFRQLVQEWYERTQTYRHIWIFELRKDGLPVGEPIRKGRTRFPLE